MSKRFKQSKGTEAVVGPMPNCNFCARQFETTKAAYDGKTRQGPWAYMCEKHFQVHGIGLGTGRGQKLFKEDI